jgi:hypothetical protein
MQTLAAMPNVAGLSSLVLVVCLLAGEIVGQPSPNTDTDYLQLRNIALQTQSLTVDKITLKRDAATFQLNSGTICFVNPVRGKVTGAVFAGEGRLLLDPPVPSERASLSLLTKEQEYSESFDQLVLRFTDGTYEELKAAGKPGGGSCDPALLRNSEKASRKEMRYNLDARILQDVLSSEAGGLFVAFVHGKHYDGRTLLFIDPHGAPSVEPEEIELETYNESKTGIWAAFHYTTEYANGTASSAQNNRVVHIVHQKLDTEIEKSGRLAGKASTTMVALAPGVRVVPFALFPSLRVSSVIGQNGEQLNFIQEDKLEDPEFWVVLSKPLAKGERLTLTTSYAGPGAVTDEGNGNYYPVTRDRWYPNSAGGHLGEYTNYDLTFRSPKGIKVIATGNPVSETTDGGHEVSLWNSGVPMTVSGFNLGDFKKDEVKLDKPDMLVQSYANSGSPNSVVGVQNRGALGSMSTTLLNKKALSEGAVALQVYSDYFGELPYKRLAMTQQTATNYGQSWPELVYLPITYLFDDTTRHFLGMDDPKGYFTVVAPHEVAHQWWGHDVGFNSYRDQWMSEGFAEMSASLYLQFIYSKDPQKFTKFWNDEREMMLNRNKEGFRPIDAGPITMGYRLSNSREGFDIYRRLIYPKGAYILHMLRMMMWDRKDGDRLFKETMHDFVTTYTGRAATTEDFKAMVEKHMTPAMDLDGNHTMDWFFNEYVYGTALPRYSFGSSFETAANGDVVLAFKLTQSGVDANFRMLVPIYLELANGQVARLGEIRSVGNMTLDKKIPLTGLKEKPRRAVINYRNDVLAAN